MKYVYHVDPDGVSDRIDLATYNIPPNKAFRVENDFHAEKLLEHKFQHHGIVVMNEITNAEDGSFKLDFDDAKQRAADGLAAADEFHLQQYAKTQLNDRVRLNFPAMPPEGRPAAIIKRRNLDIGEEFGFVPPGLKSKIDEKQKQIDGLVAANTEMKDANDKLAAQIAELMKRVGSVEEAVS